MRKVTVFEWWRPYGSENHVPFEKVVAGVGVFHQFGTDCTENEINIGTYTSAIVEMTNGEMKNVPVEMIRFDDREEMKDE